MTFPQLFSLAERGHNVSPVAERRLHGNTKRHILRMHSEGFRFAAIAEHHRVTVDDVLRVLVDFEVLPLCMVEARKTNGR